MTRNEKFKKLIENPGIVVAPGVYDAIGARLVQKIGFDACYMGGNASVASSLGYPDIGLATMTEMVRLASNLTSCIDIPLICDSDNGYGGLNNVRRAVQSFEKAGVSAIHIEDQVFPKRCGAMQGVKLISDDEAIERVKIAVKSKTDPNFLIIARTDARRVYGLDEAIRRAKLFADAGADIVFLEQLESKEEIFKVTTSINNAPVMYDILEETRDLIFSVKDLENLGVKVCIFALSTVLYISQKLEIILQKIRDTGTTIDLYDEMMKLHDYESLMGLQSHNSIRDLL